MFFPHNIIVMSFGFGSTVRTHFLFFPLILQLPFQIHLTLLQVEMSGRTFSWVLSMVQFLALQERISELYLSSTSCPLLENNLDIQPEPSNLSSTDPGRAWVTGNLYGPASRLTGEMVARVSETLRIYKQIYSLQIVKHVWYHVHNFLQLLSWDSATHSLNCCKARWQARGNEQTSSSKGAGSIWVDVHSAAGLTTLKLCTTSLVLDTGWDVSWNSGRFVLCI